MRQFIVAIATALAVGSFAVHAQEATVKSTTKVKGDDVKPVTFTGCLQTGTEAHSFILDKVVPVSSNTKTEVTGTSGQITKTTTTTYALVPAERVELQQYVGHKVEVTGIQLSGDSKTETRTKVEREDAKDVKTKEKSKTDNGAPQLRVTSIKHLADSCTM
jgi:hypothetical protein